MTLKRDHVCPNCDGHRIWNVRRAPAPGHLGYTSLPVAPGDACTLEDVIDRDTALGIATDYLAQGSAECGHELALFEHRTAEYDVGWVFYYSTRKHVETGDFRFGLPGNAPFLVDSVDGSVHTIGVGQGPVEEFVVRYRLERDG